MFLPGKKAFYCVERTQERGELQYRNRPCLIIYIYVLIHTIPTYTMRSTLIAAVVIHNRTMFASV